MTQQIPWDEWDQIAQSNEYRQLDLKDKNTVKLGWFKDRAAETDEFMSIGEQNQVALLNGFFKPGDAEYGEKPGVLKSAAQGVVRGTEGMAAAVGDVVRWAGDLAGSKTVSDAGKTASEYWNNESQRGWEAPDPRVFSDTFFNNPSVARAAGLVGEAFPWLAGGVASGGALTAAGMGPLAATAIVSTGMSGMEGAGTYSESRDAGKSVGESSAYGALATAGTAILEAIPIGKFLGKKTGFIKGGIEGLVAEGVTEGAQTAWQNLIAKVGYDGTREIMAGVIDSMIAGGGTGAAVGALMHNVGKAKESGVSDEDIANVIADVQNQVDQTISEKPDAIKSKMQESFADALPSGKAESVGKETIVEQAVSEDKWADVKKDSRQAALETEWNKYEKERQLVEQQQEREDTGSTEEHLVSDQRRAAEQRTQDIAEDEYWKKEQGEILNQRLALENRKKQQRADEIRRLQQPTTYQQPIDELSVTREMMRDQLRQSPDERAREVRASKQLRQQQAGPYGQGERQRAVGPIEAERMLNEYERLGLEISPKLMAQLQDIMFQNASPGQRINTSRGDSANMRRVGTPWEMGGMEAAARKQSPTPALSARQPQSSTEIANAAKKPALVDNQTPFGEPQTVGNETDSIAKQQPLKTGAQNGLQEKGQAEGKVKLSTNPGTGISTQEAADYFNQRGFQTKVSGNSVTVGTPSGNIGVNVVDSIVDDDGATIRIAYGREPNPGEKVAGSYFNGDVRLQRDTADKFTLTHEIVHHMKAAKLFNRAEEAVLKRIGNEEAQARWIENGLRDRAKKTGAVRNIMRKVGDFLDALANVFVRTKRGIMRDVDSGKILKRSRERSARPDASLATKKQTDTFDASNLDIRYSTRELAQKYEDAKAALPRHFEEFMYWMVDKNHPISVIQSKLKNIREEFDLFLKETGRPKITADRVDRFWTDHVTPLIEYVAKNKIELQDLEIYSHAMHAHEANNHLRYANSKMEVEKILNVLDGAQKTALRRATKNIKQPMDWYDALNAAFEKYGDNEKVQEIRSSWQAFSEKPSGMSDSEAENILSEYNGDEKIEKARQMLAAINSGRLNVLYDSGQITKEEYEKINGTYQHYVPLNREGYNDDLHGASRGLNPSGRQIKIRSGSTRNVVNIVANSIANYERAINIAEKAKSQRALYQMILENPGQNTLRIEEVHKTPRYDNSGNLRMYPDVFKVADNEMRLMFGGKQYLVTVDRNNDTAMRLMRTLKSEDNMGGPIVNALSRVNQILARLNTSWSPEFMLSNFPRDLQTAMVNINDTGVKGKGFLKGALKAVKAIHNVERGQKTGSDLEKLYDRYKLAGGKIGWSNAHGSVESLANKLKTELDIKSGKRPALKAIRSWMETIEHANTAVENGVRLHAFKLCVDSGMSDLKAGQIASDITVDFTKKGAAGPVINSLYLFSNAGIQGSYRILRAGIKSSRVRKIMGGIFGASVAVGLMNAMAGEGDDGKKYIDNVKDFIKEKNMVFIIPNTNGKYISIPMPWGYNVVWSAGTEVAKMITSPKYDIFDGAMRIAVLAANAFNPIASGTLLQTLSPTIADPFVQVAENKNWFGGDLMPAENKFSKVPKPDSERYWKSASTGAKWISKKLNSLTGGDSVESGKIDVSPETVDLIVDTSLGSAFRFFKDIGSASTKFIRGEEIAIHEIPGIRRAFGQNADWSSAQDYFANIENVYRAKERLKLYAGSEERDKFVSSNRGLISMIGYMGQIEKRLRILNKQKQAAELSGNKEAVKYLEKQINDTHNRFNKRYNEVINAE